MEKEKEGCKCNNYKKKVMVAIDESESSYYTFKWVLDNLKELLIANNSPLLVFFSQPIPNFNYAPNGYGTLPFPFSYTMDLISNAREQNKKVAFGILEKAEKICTSRGVKVETITEVGEPRELICNAVEKYKIDILVVGNDEVGAFKRAILGSLSNYCLNNAKCSVVVVKKPE